MKGLELAERFYNEYGAKMIESEFGGYADKIAVGLCGEGSECFGFDDEISTDHDFEPGFCLWILKSDEANLAFDLQRAYSRLPKEFNGFKRQLLAPAGGKRHGVMSVGDFYKKFIGVPGAPESVERWLFTPTEYLACACNGKVFRDDCGAFSSIRNVLKAGYPEDIRRKKIAAHTVFTAQAGQYNFLRCIRRGENGAAQLAVFEFVKHAVSIIYLLNNVYEPFYKWAYRGMRDLSFLSQLEHPLAALTQMGNLPEETEAKQETIEEIASIFIDEYIRQGLTDAAGNDLESHAFSIVKSIKNPILRNMHIMDGA